MTSVSLPHQHHVANTPSQMVIVRPIEKDCESASFPTCFSLHFVHLVSEDTLHSVDDPCSQICPMLRFMVCPPHFFFFSRRSLDLQKERGQLKISKRNFGDYLLILMSHLFTCVSRVLYL